MSSRSLREKSRVSCEHRPTPNPPPYLTPYARMMRPMRTPIVPSRYQTLGSCLKTSALMRMEKPMTPPTRELNPERSTHTHPPPLTLLHLPLKVTRCGWGVSLHPPSVTRARLVRTLPSMNLTAARRTQISPLTMDTLNRKTS